MKAILLTIALSIGLGAFAQKGDHVQKTSAEKAQHRTEQMVKDLGLDAAQKEKVASINLSYATAMAQVNTITIEKDREGRSDVLKGNRDNSLQKVLTNEQYAKMLSLRTEKKAKHEAEKKDKKIKKVKSDD